MIYKFIKASIKDLDQVWQILQQAIERRRQEGSDQWQDGYPNAVVIERDIKNGEGYVLLENDRIIGYSAVGVDNEPAYENIRGKWISEQSYMVIHRVALADGHVGKGLARRIFGFVEDLALQNDIYSIKADTNYDNIPMLKLFERLGYMYCGEVSMRGSARKAFEKLLVPAVNG